MILANLFFFGGLAFLGGAAAASVAGYVSVAVSPAFLLAPRRAGFAFLLAFAYLTGVLYYSVRADRTGAGVPRAQPVPVEIVSGYRETQNAYQYVAQTVTEPRQSILVYVPAGTELVYGDVLLARDIRISDSPRYRGITLFSYIDAPSVYESRASPLRSLFEFKYAVRGRMEEMVQGDRGKLLGGILYGEQPPYELKQKMIRSGTIHIAVVSGQNITLLTRMVDRALLVLPFGRVARALATSVAVSGFAAFVGPEPSTLRAVCMGLLTVFVGLMGRLPLRRNVLLGAALFLVALDPLILRFDIGFWLSFLSVAGIFYLAPLWETRIPSQILRETLAAQVMTLPLVLHTFGRIAPNGVLANLLILPLIPYTMALGLVTLAAAFLVHPLALVLSVPLNALLQYESAVIAALGSFGLFSVSIPFLGMIGMYGAMIAYLVRRYRGKLIDFNFQIFKDSATAGS